MNTVMEKRIQDFREFKKKLSDMMVDYCKMRRICLKCHNPNKFTSEGKTCCDECSEKMKAFSRKRYIALKEAKK